VTGTGDSGATQEGGTTQQGGDASTSAGGVSVTVNPVSVAVSVSAHQSYACTVTGSTNTSCTWSVRESGGGSLSPASGSSSLYTAPATVGTYHVVAASAAQPMATATATVTVVNQVVGDCSNLPSAGTWENVTPAALNMGEWCIPYTTGCPNPGVSTGTQIGTYGTHAFALDPNNPGTVYLGTSQLGFYKSTNCGSTWVHIDTGAGSDDLDKGRNWTIVIDPTNSSVLYTTSGYDKGGVYKSTDGGVSWTQVLTANVMQVATFIEKITMDPTNSQHLLVSFHETCKGTPLPGAMTDGMGGWACLAESPDAGKTWSLTTSGMAWAGTDGPGQTMVDSKTWFYGTNGSNGLWRTTTGGVSPDGTSSAWTKVFSGTVNGSVYKATNGVYYVGGSLTGWSTDGISWQTIPNSPGGLSHNGSTNMVDDGTTFYGANGSAYYTAPLAAGALTFSKMASSAPLTSAGSTVAQLDYDKSHHILYSNNLSGGFWRVVTP
jgi:hypothetical protein